ncbi:DUF317 domain-containing protein [Catenulispora rubra]|uniref:DUF317 domain-containing protein n=1 Tax=Catenulispora rubra TaxID=280293 RepID=UPI00189209E1|nr:DUF317 domain-containing protein [Catenulispora rubra]
MSETTPAATLEHAEDSEPTMPPPVTVPVYAAGAGAPDLALDRLRDAGWIQYANGIGDVAYRSPDGSVRAEFAPESRSALPRGVLWEVAYTDPDPYTKNRNSWTAHFSDHVPAEAIASFLATLTDPTGLELDR